MTIRLIKEPDIHLTQAEHERLSRQWQAEQQYTTAPQSFETWLRRRADAEKHIPFDAGFMVSKDQGETK